MPRQSAAQRAWYERNREAQIAANAERRRQMRQAISDYKASQSCAVCGESDPVCLDFHHEGTKEFAIAKAVNDGLAASRIWAEVAACVVLCANCHRKHHATQSDRLRSLPSKQDNGVRVSGVASTET
jgi:hypothetical protein